MNSSQFALVNLLTQFVVTVFMTGVIWMVQLVVYPQFADVGPDTFDAYHAVYMQRVSFVVFPPMMIELAASCWAAILFWQTRWRVWMLVGAMLSLLLWACTFFVQVPLHTQLTLGYSRDAILALVETNWIRTLLWSMRAALLGIVLMQSLDIDIRR